MRSALSQEAGEAVRDGRLGEQHHPELGALAAHVTQQPQQRIRGHRALLSLVDDQNPVLPQQRVRHHLLQQESVCDKPAESRRYAGVKAVQSTGGERGPRTSVWFPACSRPREGPCSPPPAPDSSPSHRPLGAPDRRPPPHTADSSTPDPERTRETERTPHTTEEPALEAQSRETRQRAEEKRRELS